MDFKTKRSTPIAEIKRPAGVLENPNFQRWFSGSKVVDEQGKPLIVYHGGTFDAERDPIFRKGRSFGFFFSTDRHLAENYGKPFGEKPKVTEVCLRLRNPFEPAKWEHVYGAPWVQKWIDFWRKEEGWIDRDSGAEMDDDQVLQMISDTRLYHYEENGLKLSERWDDFLRTAADHHDGFMGDDPTDRAFILVAFESNQIKSPSLNSGEFSLKDPSIDR